MPDNFQLVAGHVALDFANTLDNRYSPEGAVELLPGYERFVAFGAQAGMVTAQQARRLVRETSETEGRRTLERVIELREAFHFVFLAVARGEAPARTDVAVLNRFLAEAYLPKTVAWEKGEFVWRSADLGEKSWGPLWAIAEAGANLLTSGDRAHIRECSAQTCRWLFLDHSKNHSRMWCDMKMCGNRAKAQRYQARQRREA